MGEQPFLERFFRFDNETRNNNFPNVSNLVNYMGARHLIAFCRMRNDWRDFLLSRISNCLVSDEQLTKKYRT